MLEAHTESTVRRGTSSCSTSSIAVGLPGSEADAPFLESLAEVFGCTPRGAESCHYDLSQAGDGVCYECELCDLVDPRPSGVDYTCSFPLEVTGAANYATGRVTVRTFDARTGEGATIELDSGDFSIETSGDDATLELAPEVCELIPSIVGLEASFPCQ
jgi:hypothetical protein